MEGRTYGSIEEKVAAIEAEMGNWAAAPDRVRRLVDWGWITDAVRHLPQPDLNTT